MDDLPLPTMGGSYLREADGSLTPVDGPALVAIEGPIEAQPETPPDPAPAEEQPQ